MMRVPLIGPQNPLRTSRWPGLLVAALLVVACVLLLTSGVRAVPSVVSQDGLGAVTALSDSAPLATLTATPSVARTLLQQKLGVPGVSLLLAVVAAALWASCTARDWTVRPPRAAPGLRGRPLLYASLN